MILRNICGFWMTKTHRSLKLKKSVLPNIVLGLGLGMVGVIASATSFQVKQKPIKTDLQSADFFESKIRPLLVEKCFGCHGATKQQSGLRLDTSEFLLKGNAGGPTVIPGHPEKSPLIQVVAYDGAIKMPPSGKLKAEEILALTEWVKSGAAWPTSKPTDAAKPAPKSGEFMITADQRNFWSFKPVAKPSPPATKLAKWCISPIDNFVLAKLEQKKLVPSAATDKRTLIRRVTLDLTGLPPSNQEVDDFILDTQPNAYEKVVDRLLASPRYGERWARLWMDVARYADTKGYVFVEDRNYYNAYTYRDYLIRSFNEDVPYDKFITQQLAADKMDLGDNKLPLAAMGFLTLGRRFLNSAPDIIDDRIDVVCRGLLGLTTNCARCHDHKFDPIATKDYYALYGIFDSSVEGNPAISPKSISEPYEKYVAKYNGVKAERSGLVRAEVSRLREIVKKSPDELSGPIKQTLQALRPETEPDQNQLNILAKSFEPAKADRVRSLGKEIAILEGDKPPQPDLAMAMADAPNPHNVSVFIRGNPGLRGPVAPRQFLSILTSPDSKPYSNGSGRLELAQSIVSKDNPLTARVFVNRVWKHHFGFGLVRTPSDFGFRGDPPTHPELLDFLASKFMDNAWSIKKLHKMMLLSNTYKLSAVVSPLAYQVDPENRLLSHANRRRMDLEQIRDSVLSVSGSMDYKVGGKSVELTTEPHTTRRSVYGFIERQNLPGYFRTFDLASPDTTSSQRFSTTVPQQALFMMNSPFVVKEAQALARRAEFAASQRLEDRIVVAYQLIFARVPTIAEITVGKKFLESSEPKVQTAGIEKKPIISGGETLTGWERYLQALMMTNEFVFID